MFKIRVDSRSFVFDLLATMTIKGKMDRTLTTTSHRTEFAPLNIGPIEVWPPVVLAPMAGITNAPFRRLCREFGAGLYVSEMITSRKYAEDDPYTLKLASFAEDESPRSIQLYGTDPEILGRAVNKIADTNGADHIDINFGCPVRKVTRKGGGAAIPLKKNLFRNLIRAAVSNAGTIPVTVKFRIGIDDSYQSYLSSGQIAEEEGCASVALHARTAAQLYDGNARWEAIARLKEAVTTIPVLGNGDIWEAKDALRMMRETGCDGVVVGRGCLGRPWLFGQLAAAFAGRALPPHPTLQQAMAIMIRHAELLCDWYSESLAIRSFRKHCSWYLKSYAVNPTLRSAMVRVDTLAELKSLVDDIDLDMPLDTTTLRVPRGKGPGTQKVVLPQGYLDQLEDATPPCAAAEDPASGG